MRRPTTPSITNKATTGYIIIAPLSEENRQILHQLQDKISSRFNRISFWFPRDDQLHITVAHIITPETMGGEAANSLYRSISNQALAALQIAIPNPLTIEVEFNSVEAFPGVIIVKGQDNGSYSELRKAFVNNFPLPEGTRLPPNIIHSTIARFYDEVELDEVANFVEHLKVNFTQTTKDILVIRENKVFTQEYDVLKRFPG